MKEYLKAARVKVRLSQKNVSQALGHATPQFISNWERGKSTPPIKDIKQLCRLYRLNFDDFSTRLINHKISELMNSLKEQIDEVR